MEILDCSMGHSTLNRMSIVPDGIGLLALSIQAYLVFGWSMPDDESRLSAGILAFVLLASCAFYTWHLEKANQKIDDLGGWAGAVGFSVLSGALSFGGDMLVGTVSYPGLSPFEAATKVGSPFGFGLTVILCPGFAMVAIAGFARALVLRGEYEQLSAR
jgi:hypothetical protein